MNVKPGRGSWALTILVLPLITLMVFLILVGLYARSLSRSGATSGSIRLYDVSLQTEAAQLYLSAAVDIELPEPIRDGLDSGVPLDFILTLGIRQPRVYWFDRSVAQYEHRYRLSYYELTRHYRVQALDTGISRNYRSLNAALSGLGTIERLPMVLDIEQAGSINLIDFDETLPQMIAELEFKLDSKSLPLPLQPLIAFSWRLDSKEYQWQVN